MGRKIFPFVHPNISSLTKKVKGTGLALIYRLQSSYPHTVDAYSCTYRLSVCCGLYSGWVGMQLVPNPCSPVMYP